MYLNTHTYYSSRYGTIKPKELLEIAKNKGLKTQEPKKKSSGHYHCDTLGEKCRQFHAKYTN